MFRKLLNNELGRPALDEYKELEKRPVTVVLDNIRSRHNIGSAFRTADAFRIERIILCGISSTEPAAQVHKSALGAEFSVEWKYFDKTTDAVAHLKEQGYTILSVEQAEDSVTLDSFISRKREIHDEKYAVILGNEVHGVDQNAVNMSDWVIEIPQYGTKHSLNVSVALGIVLYNIASLFPIKDS